MTVSRISIFVASACVLAGVECDDKELPIDAASTNSAREEEREENQVEWPSTNVTVPSLSAVVPRTPEACPHAFEPSLVPVEAPLIHRKNSAQRVQYARKRLERVEVIELSTNRVLFSIDDATVEALRHTPSDPPICWDRNSRTASLPAWPIALLFYISGEPRPFLGWFFDDGDVYFVDEADPWDVAVFEPDGETFRDVFPIPTNSELSWLLSKRFGKYDPFDQLRWSAQRREDSRCGRVSQPRGETFPQLPKAIIEPAD